MIQGPVHTTEESDRVPVNNHPCQSEDNGNNSPAKKKELDESSYQSQIVELPSAENNSSLPSESSDVDAISCNVSSESTDDTPHLVSSSNTPHLVSSNKQPTESADDTFHESQSQVTNNYWTRIAHETELCASDLKPDTATGPVHTVSKSLSECVVCSERAIDTVILPCAHMWLCRTCAKLLLNEDRDCPACRGPIQEIKTVYTP